MKYCFTDVTGDRYVQYMNRLTEVVIQMSEKLDKLEAELEMYKKAVNHLAEHKCSCKDESVTEYKRPAKSSLKQTIGSMTKSSTQKSPIRHQQSDEVGIVYYITVE